MKRSHIVKHILVFALLQFAMLPAYSEDIDIFLGSGEVPDGARPNVLFIIDNSSSMASPLSGTSQTRMEVMKESFTEVLNSVSGVNIGFMRFNAPGGAIGYPVRNIDDVVTASLSSNPAMISGSDDAVEFLVDRSVDIDSEVIHLGWTEVPESDVTEITVALSSEAENSVEVISNGRNKGAGEASFNLNANDRLGLRFANLGIPSGVIIEEARIVFSSNARGTGDVQFDIVGESSGDATAFDFSRRELEGRLGSPTATTIRWNVTGDWAEDVTYRTENFADILQEQIGHASWSDDNAVVYILEPVGGSSDRSVDLVQDGVASTEGDAGTGPKLYVRYSSPSDRTVNFLNLAGFRFANISVPKGATINSAQINFYAAENSSASSRFYIGIQNSGDAETFEATPRNILDGTTRPWHPSAFKAWNVTETWVLDQPVSGPDVTNLIQSVINDNADWCGNNAMTFFIYPDSPSSSRRVYSYDRGESFAPTLEIDYTAPATPGCINPRYATATAATEDDAIEVKSGNVDNEADRMYVSVDDSAALRFRTLPIKQGAVIQEAYLELTAYPYGEAGYESPAGESNTGALTINIHGEDTDHSMGITESRNNITDRALTAASVSWSPDSWDGLGVYRSPDISRIIQDIVGRSGWDPGNALTLILSTTSSNGRGIMSWDGGAGYAPQLVMKIANGGFDSSNNTVRTHINAAVGSLEARTWSPIVDTLYEAARYYRGESVLYGQARGISGQRQGHTEKRFKRVSHPDSWEDGASHTLPAGCLMTDSSNVACEDEHITGFSDGSTSPASNTSKRYLSPISSSCQSNHIIVLTDGHSDNLHTPTINGVNSLPGVSSCESDVGNVDERCARTLVEFLANEDQSGSIDGINTITTHSIAFNADNGTARRFMEDLASYGGGQYYLTSTGAELVTAINEVLRHIIVTNTTFTTPGATVNQFNRLNHRNEVYFSLFRPAAEPKWHGNLKRYQVAGDPPVLVDQNMEYAINEETGFFKDSAKSFWSTSVDGDDIALGGAAYQLPDDPATRKFYTYLSGVSGATTNLTAPINQFHESNTDITAAMILASDATERSNIMKWVRGVDVLDWDGDSDTLELRKQMGDPLHSVPAVVTYGGTDAAPDVSVFFGTNEGVLHAIDADSGEEHFAFMPMGTYGIVKKLYQNTDAYTHPYGLDGSPLAWVYDENGDKQISSGSDHVYLYVGMRRGGQNYYAMDVTDRAAPRMLWEIEGGTGDFALLGQTWSKPVKTKVQIGSTVKDVLIIGGGFDPAQDGSPNSRLTHSMGNAIYIVDAVTGKRLWWSSNAVSAGDGLYDARMDYAIPAEVAVIDMDGDSLADQMYVGDLGGQVWRFDIHNGESVSGLVTGGVIADLGGAVNADFRRFFFTPDVAYISRKGSPALAITIGSGAVNEPLDEVTEDRFYVLFQADVFGAPDSITPVTESNLSNRTSDYSDPDVADAGWYIELENPGEKSLSTPVVINNKLLFTTYEPEVAASTACSAVTGLGRLYLVDVLGGGPIEDLDDSGSLNKDDRSKALKAKSVPPSPKVLFPEDASSPMLLVGPETIPDLDLGVTADWQKVYWYEE